MSCWNRVKSQRIAIDAFEQSIEGETATVLKETRQSYPPAWQCSATCHKTDQDVLRNAKTIGFTSPAILSRLYSIRLSFVSIDGTRPGSSAFLLLWWSQKMDLQFFQRGNRALPERWEKVVASDGQYFEWSTIFLKHKLIITTYFMY